MAARRGEGQAVLACRLRQGRAKRTSGKGRKTQRGTLLPPLRYFGSEYVLNAETGMFYRVTPTAMVLLQAMSEGLDNERLVEAIQAHGAVDRLTATRDVELLINELSVRGILSAQAAKPRS